MKILLLYDYPPKGTGLSVLGETVHKGLEELGHEITPHSLFDWGGIERLLQTQKFSLCLGVGYWNDAPREVSLPKKYGVKTVVYWVSEGVVPKYQDIIPQADLLLATSEYSQEVFARDLPSMKEKIKVLYPGTDTDFYVPSSTPPQKIFSTFVSSGAVKGCEEALEALRIVVRTRVDFKYIIHTPNVEYPLERDYYLKLQRKIKEYNLEKVAQLTTHKFKKHFMPALYQSLWFYLAPLRQACFGLPLIEAGACGVPTLTGNWKPMSEIVNHRVSGLLFSHAEVKPVEKFLEGVSFREEWFFASAESMADKILEILGDEKSRNEWGQNARKIVEERFNYKKQSKLLEKELLSVVG